ncbi:hypothetical protein O6H91_07G067100 [Diphasiastrum complanatum]|uniref:Uncharacterized protein n=1 Tax=Diphasiastrum complanatum TaxID=34168 RepID=A0ACC2D6J1_DIPCM|nr:hypothetical protein O6H91_07G067100 [Diphasiastrum complanatum]
MSMSCSFPLCLSGIIVSPQVLLVKRSDSYCVQSKETSTTADVIFRKDCLSSCVTLSGSSSAPSTSVYSKDAISLIKTLVTRAKYQCVEKKLISATRRRRQAVIKEMTELDRRREILKQQRTNQECLTAHLQMQDFHALQHSQPDTIQALCKRPLFCLEHCSDLLCHSMAANAA